MADNLCVSIIVPFYNEANNVQVLAQRLSQVLNGLPYGWEVICINDGSSDNTLMQLIALHQQDARFKIIDFSRNFGKEAAISAGLDLAQGDAVIPLDADLQHPPEYIPQLIAQWQAGAEIVNALRENRQYETFIKRWAAKLFYRIMNKLSKVDLSQKMGDFRLLSRPVVNALKQLPERRRFMKGLFNWVGFRSASILYQPANRYAGKTKFNYWKLWNFALEGITSFSQVPLQIASYVGLIIALCSFSYGIYLFIKTLVWGNPVPGYPSLMVAILFMGGVQLVALGIMGEYLGRIYDEVKQRPLYIVRKLWH